MSIRNNLVKALARKYEAAIAEATATVEIYLDNSVGIGEHPQHIQELDKLLTKISNVYMLDKTKKIKGLIKN